MSEDFRSAARARALDAAHALLLEKGWDKVRFGQIAEAARVSRPTLYALFGDKVGLAEALVLRETDAFLAGVAAALGEHDDDLHGAVRAAVAFTLAEAARNPVLHAILTSTRGGSDSLLPLLTTRSGPVIAAATSLLTEWLSQQRPDIPGEQVAEGVDALVRLVVSHLVLPAQEASRTPDRLAGLALRYLV
jgi:AcrR family transcriptional regulator